MMKMQSKMPQSPRGCDGEWFKPLSYFALFRFKAGESMMSEGYDELIFDGVGDGLEGGF